jgi:predicted Rossmann fold nucleotide-binding protein DprA/Smf involved in DNA uptake
MLEQQAIRKGITLNAHILLILSNHLEPKEENSFADEKLREIEKELKKLNEQRNALYDDLENWKSYTAKKVKDIVNSDAESKVLKMIPKYPVSELNIAQSLDMEVYYVYAILCELSEKGLVELTMEGKWKCPDKE